MTKLPTVVKIILGLLLLLIIVTFSAAPGLLEASLNVVKPHPAYTVSDEAQILHDSLVIGDLHADSTLWNRDLLDRGTRGQVDIARMREGNAALQMFTSVTKSPKGQNYEENTAEAGDNITNLMLIQAWPPSTWSSLTARALHQSKKLHSYAVRAPDQFSVILSAQDLDELLERRSQGELVVGGLLGTEGSHALDANLDNIQVLYDAGFRMMSLQHFFDNALGGSLHGISGDGLTEFGRQAVDKMVASNIMIDVSHSAPQVVEDVLDRSDTPLIVSHTGFYGHCQSHRNISDELMKKIATGGGIIGVGFWDAAVCETSVEAIVASIRYGIDLVGEDHVALGSDFDGSVETPFDISELSALTQQMLSSDFSEIEIRKVMGGNMVSYLRKNLPAQ
ncbi:MAG: microsomal dipeptidase-like Zn-dependent dipeptidase [Halioglobus sp.]|jgi:microsomal dipeptidase-like Zn-dependent dipeptidase